VRATSTPQQLRPGLLSLALLVGAFGLIALLAACGGGVRPTLTSERLVESPTPETTEIAAPTATALAVPTQGSEAPVEQLAVQVLETFPHDAAAFTQGLELDGGLLLESTGLNGQSDLRRVIPETGVVIQSVPTPNDFFAEGLTKVGDQLIQLTWTENTAFFWDAASFELRKEVTYQGEGWGICYDGAQLIMTDGTPVLIFRDPTTFEETGRVAVTRNGEDVLNLNEIECVNGVVWANVWKTDLIMRIDPTTGVVTGVVDAASLDGPTEPSGAVLNGIAWDEQSQSFYITGKLWPTMYRVNFVPVPS